MKRLCFIFILVCLCFTYKLYAQTSTGVVNKVYIDHTGTNSNDKITIHIDCNIKNMLGQQALVCAFFYKENSPYKLRKDSEYYSEYCNYEGHVTVQKIVTPSYQNAHFHDIKLSLPSYVLSKAKNDGKYNDYEPQPYNVDVCIYDKQRGVYISQSFVLPFFVSRQVQVCPCGPMCGICFGTGQIGGLYRSVCPHCKGTGKCIICKGTGLTYDTYTGSTKSQVEQYIQHNLHEHATKTGVTIPQNSYPSGISSEYGNGTSTSLNNTRRVCPGCNGTGKGKRETIYGTDYTGGQVTYICPECNLTTPHTHRTPTCSICHGKGYVEH